MYQKLQTNDIRRVLQQCKREGIDTGVIVGRITRTYSGQNNYSNETTDEVFLDVSQNSCITCDKYTECMLKADRSSYFKSNICNLNYKMKLLEYNSTDQATMLSILESPGFAADLDTYVNKYKHDVPKLVTWIEVIAQYGKLTQKQTVISALLKYAPTQLAIRAKLSVDNLGHVYGFLLNQDQSLELLNIAAVLIRESTSEHWVYAADTKRTILEIVIAAEAHGWRQEVKDFITNSYTKVLALPSGYRVSTSTVRIKNRTAAPLTEVSNAVMCLLVGFYKEVYIDYELSKIIQIHTSALCAGDNRYIVAEICKSRILPKLPCEVTTEGGADAYDAEDDATFAFKDLIHGIFAKSVKTLTDAEGNTTVSEEVQRATEKFVEDHLEAVLNLLDVLPIPPMVV